MPRPILFAIALGVSQVACPSDPPPDDAPTIEIDNLGTNAAVVGGDPLATAYVTGCKGTPPVLTYADGVLISRSDAVVLFRKDEEGAMDVYPDGALLLTVLIPQEELTPDLYGLPVVFDLEMRVFCQDQWVKSSPYPMTYVPAIASLAPAFNPTRYWASETDVGDILACSDTKLINYIEGTRPREELDVDFPCGVASMSRGLGVRRYLEATKADERTQGVGIAAIDPGPTLAWTRPMAVSDTWNDPDRDPVVIREVDESEELLVLDRETGEDKVGPIALTHDPLGSGSITRNDSDDILVLETSVTRSPDPESRTYWVEKFDSVGVQIDLLQVAVYNYRVGRPFAAFDLAGEHIYIPAAPDDEEIYWIEKIELGAGAVVWETTPEQPWRIPMTEAGDRLLVATEDEFGWLDIETGEELTEPFGPESGNSFAQGFIEDDGSLVLIGDPIGAWPNTVGQSLYIFAPNGSTTLAFAEAGTQFRWLTPAWAEGGLVTHLGEIHWLYSRAGYEFLLE